MNHATTTETALGLDADWRLRSACTEADPELFFYPEGERAGARVKRQRAAQAVCATCPVIAECREWALETRQPYGVWGGLTEADRSGLLTGNRAAGEALQRPGAPRNRFDADEIVAAVAAVIEGDPEALRVRLNGRERPAAVAKLRETHTAAEVASLLRLDVNSVYRYTSRAKTAAAVAA